MRTESVGDDRVIRPADPADLNAILDLAAVRRRQYATYQPQFWRPAPDAAARQAPYMAGLIADPAVITLVAVTGTVVVGYAVGQLGAAPPVYDPGGSTCVVDDFTVADPGLWATVGSTCSPRSPARPPSAAQPRWSW